MAHEHAWVRACIRDDCLELTEIPGKGLGYRARRALARGEVLVEDEAYCSGNVGQYEFASMVQQCCAKAHAPFFRDEVMTLTAADAGDSSLKGILNNNVFACSRELEHTALFVAVARFNHSCCPSAFVDADAGRAAVRALREVQEGEEVCISYIPVGMGLGSRQRALSRKGFVCGCERCREEALHDPSLDVPCRCGAGSFRAEAGAPRRQTCGSCGAGFDREGAEERLARVEEANAQLQEASASSAPARDLAALLAEEGGGELPPRHEQCLLLLRNLARRHHADAASALGKERSSSMAAFAELMCRYLSLYEASYGGWTNQRDKGFLQCLNMLLSGAGAELRERAQWQEKLERACTLQFGQRELPESLRG